jgi:hypothetical protein
MAIVKNMKYEGHRLSNNLIKCKPSLKKPSGYNKRSRNATSLNSAVSLFLLTNMEKTEKINIFESVPASSKKTVRFAPMATVFPVPKTKPEEASRTWYGSSDYKSFENDRKSAVAAIQYALQNSSDVDNDKFTITGLESRVFPQQFIARRRKLLQHSGRVLRQQYISRYNHNMQQVSFSNHQPNQILATEYPYSMEGCQEWAMSYEHNPHVSRSHNDCYGYRT